MHLLYRIIDVVSLTGYSARVAHALKAFDWDLCDNHPIEETSESSSLMAFSNSNVLDVRHMQAIDEEISAIDPTWLGSVSRQLLVRHLPANRAVISYHDVNCKSVGTNFNERYIIMMQDHLSKGKSRLFRLYIKFADGGVREWTTRPLPLKEAAGEMDMLLRLADEPDPKTQVPCYVCAVDVGSNKESLSWDSEKGATIPADTELASMVKCPEARGVKDV